jgi:RNA polymerase sigma-70 factor (ECF subfamily)
MCEPGDQSGQDTVVAHRPDAAVIAASLTEPSEFGAIFDRHATILFRYLVRRVGPTEADTLLGEVFRVAFERRATFDPARPSARPWLYGIATRLLAAHRRREARRFHATARLLARAAPEDDLAERVASTLDASELWPRVADGIAALPPGERDALLLFVWEELSYEEIASALDVPVGTVRSRLNRARTRIRELGEASGGQPASQPVPIRGRIEP